MKSLSVLLFVHKMNYLKPVTFKNSIKIEKLYSSMRKCSHKMSHHQTNREKRQKKIEPSTKR